MPLHLRRRGDVWYLSGSLRVGRKTVYVPERSTGCRSRADAEAVASAEQQRIVTEALEGPAGVARRSSIAEAFLAYLRRPGGVPQYDKDRLADLTLRIGARPIGEAAQAWTEWLHSRGADMAPATAQRWRAIYVAALKAGCKAHGWPTPPEIPTVEQRQQERVAHLHDVERERLIRAYNPYANPPVLLLAYCGMRTQEALQLDWGEVDLPRARLRVGMVNRTKSRKVRTVPLSQRPLMTLWGLWEAQGRPTRGPVFWGRHGRPYADTRVRGGNPLAKAHGTACKAAGVQNFRVHDWRHDYATRFLASGGSERALMQMCGWSSAKMVSRYVTFRDDEIAAIAARVA